MIYRDDRIWYVDPRGWVGILVVTGILVRSHFCFPLYIFIYQYIISLSGKETIYLTYAFLSRSIHILTSFMTLHPAYLHYTSGFWIIDLLCRYYIYSISLPFVSHSLYAINSTRQMFSFQNIWDFRMDTIEIKCPIVSYIYNI